MKTGLIQKRSDLKNANAMTSMRIAFFVSAWVGMISWATYAFILTVETHGLGSQSAAFLFFAVTCLSLFWYLAKRDLLGMDSADCEELATTDFNLFLAKMRKEMPTGVMDLYTSVSERRPCGKFNAIESPSHLIIVQGPYRSFKTLGMGHYALIMNRPNNHSQFLKYLREQYPTLLCSKDFG